MLPTSEKLEGYIKALGAFLKVIASRIPIVVAIIFIGLWWTERKERISTCQKYYEDAKRADARSIQFLRESRDLVREALQLYDPAVHFRSMSDTVNYSEGSTYGNRN